MTGARIGERAPALRSSGFELSVESRLKADWLYNRRLYEIWAIYDHWPDGMLLNIAGPSADGVIIQAMWKNAETQDEYFGRLGIERFTEVVRQLATATEPNPVIADLEPVHRSIILLSFGPLAHAFTDIGADLDESAAHFYGTTPVAVDIRFPGIEIEQIDTLWRSLRLVDELPPRLIVRLQEIGGLGAVLETQTWLSEADARAFVEQELTPAFNELNASGDGRMECTYREIKRIAISRHELNQEPEIADPTGLTVFAAALVRQAVIPRSVDRDAAVGVDDERMAAVGASEGSDRDRRPSGRTASPHAPGGSPGASRPDARADHAGLGPKLQVAVVSQRQT